MGKTFKEYRDGGEELSVEKDSYIGRREQMDCPYESASTGDMRRSSGQAKVFDNNGGNSKAGDAGVVNKNGEYGSITYGF